LLGLSALHVEDVVSDAFAIASNVDTRKRSRKSLLVLDRHPYTRYTRARMWYGVQSVDVSSRKVSAPTSSASTDKKKEGQHDYHD